MLYYSIIAESYPKFIIRNAGVQNLLQKKPVGFSTAKKCKLVMPKGNTYKMDEIALQNLWNEIV